MKKKEFNLTKEEKENLKLFFKEEMESFDVKNPKLSKECQMNIRIAVNSGDKELFDLGCIMAYTAIENHYKSKVYKKYLINGSNEIEVSDYMSELFIAISNNIKKYDGVHSLFTFFDPILNSVFMITRETSKGMRMSKYYQDVGVTISRAETDLQSKGFTDYSITDIRDYIELKYNKKIPEVTIENFKTYNNPIGSIEDVEAYLSVEDDMSPERQTIKNEEKMEFYHSAKKLSTRHRFYLEKEIEFLELNGVMPTALEMLEIYQEFQPDITKDDIDRLRRSTHRELKNYYRSSKKREIPINNMKTMQISFTILEEDEANIKRYIKNEIGYYREKGKDDEWEEMNLDDIEVE